MLVQALFGFCCANVCSRAVLRRVCGPCRCGNAAAFAGPVCAVGPVMHLWQHDVVRFWQRVVMAQLCAGGGGKTVFWRCCGMPAGGSSKRLSVLFRGLCFAGQQPDPRLLLPQASRRTSPPRGTGTAGTISADHGGAAAAVRRSEQGFRILAAACEQHPFLAGFGTVCYNNKRP